MPELPEVETIARGLQESVAGRRILSVTLRKTDFIDDPVAIERELPGRRIARVERFGKFMLLRLANKNDALGTAADSGAADRNATPNAAIQEALLVHLGMTGNLAPHHAQQPLAKHTHVTFVLDDGRELRYTDPRRFGRMAYLAGETLATELLRFGAEPLLVTAEEFARRVRSSRARIKTLLLDQRVLRGVGNIYADESLWSARIHPSRAGGSLKLEEVGALLRALQRILRKAIQMRGSSISDFVDADGVEGDYQQHHKVYGREGEKCFRCGATIQRIIVAGRSSHFCPVCQRAPRRKSGSGVAAVQTRTPGGARVEKKKAKRRMRLRTSKG
jgi:formamidopyrimidine-DNA glycosylase